MKRLLAVAFVTACGNSSSSPELDAAAVGPPEVWTWHAVPGMVCGDGSPTGIAAFTTVGP